MIPRDAMLFRIGSNVALEVHVITLLYVIRVKSTAQRHRQHRPVYRKKNFKSVENEFKSSKTSVKNQKTVCTALFIEKITLSQSSMVLNSVKLV